MLTELEILGERIAEQAAHLDAALHRVFADLREFDTRGGWRTQGALSCAHWLSWRVGWDLVTARERVRVARKLADHALIDDALRRGEVSYSKVRAMLRVATEANEAMLLEYARLTTAAQLEMLTRKYALVQRHGQDHRPQEDALRRYIRGRDTADGMIKIEAVLHPEEAELVWTMLDHAAKRLLRDRDEPSASTPSIEWQPPAAEPAADDSAESRALLCPRHPAAVAPADPHHTATAPNVQLSGSAESSRTPRSPEIAQSDDSAESGNRTERHCETHDVTGQEAITTSFVEATPAVQGGLFEMMCDEISAFERAQRSRSAQVPSARADLGDPAAAASAAGAVHSSGTSGVTSALRQRVTSTRRAFERADALVWISHSYLRGEQLNRSPVDVTLTISASDLQGGASEPTEVARMGDSFLSNETARRLSCDAGVTEVIEDEHGVPLRISRKRRTIAGALKRALLRRDGRCTFPGCTHRTFLEGHHIRHWADGGETSLDNAALLCSFHHRHVHEYGYAIDLGPDGRPRFRDPQGRLIAITIACEWDGAPPDYGALVGYLAALDGPGSHADAIRRA